MSITITHEYDAPTRKPKIPKIKIKINWQVNKWKLIGLLKLGSFALIITVGGLLFVWQNQRIKAGKTGVTPGFSSLLTQTDGAILSIPYQKTLYKHFGQAINPQIKLPIKTIDGFKEMEFLVDSGAVVSAMPKTKAEELGVDLVQLSRITIQGFAGQKTFAYKGEMIVKIGQEEVLIPVVFSENPQASNILGRIGFFDKFNINFNADSEKIIISRKG